ncbi:MAG: hypothetical protein ACREO8_08070 [Luteimonas sp.]
MKTPRRMMITGLCAALLSACGKHEAPVPGAPPAAQPPFYTVPHTATVDVAIGKIESQTPLPLSDSASAKGQIVSTAAGKLVGVSVFIGNYFNTATGAFDLEACVADHCQRASVDAAKSADNQMLEFALPESIDLAAGVTVTYTFSRAAGTNPIALWTYSAVTPTDHLLAPGDVARTAKVSLLLN